MLGVISPESVLIHLCFCNGHQFDASENVWFSHWVAYQTLNLPTTNTATLKHCGRVYSIHLNNSGFMR